MATISTTLTLIDNMTSKLESIRDAVEDVENELKGVGDKQSDIDGVSWQGFLDNAEKAAGKMESIGKRMTLAISAPVAALGKKMYGNATDYEAAYVAMRKTVEGGRAAEEQYQHIADVAEDLSTKTPMTYVELLGTAQDAGNAGVAIDQMEDFLTVYSALQYATDRHINGTEGIKAVASFLNITDGGVQDIERFSNSIAFLGVNANTTEDEILQMANRFASAATIAGFGKADILGMAAAFESVGIRAEAGGSSAAKLIKQFQLSAEVGGQAQEKLAAIGQEFDSALDFSNYIGGLSKGDLTTLAGEMNMTAEAVQSMADSWLLLDQFSEVSGKTSQQFIDDWSKNPAQAMQDFFYGLNRLGDGGADSILATLDRMGLTEIRESNLIAAMATRPEMFANMIAIATQGYQENISMWEQFGQQMETQESKNAMLSNKLNNTMADFGQNVVDALQPALETVNNILEAFNSLSEIDQSKIVNLMGALVISGPTLWALGSVAGLMTKIATAMTTISGAGAGAASAVEGVAGAAGGAGLAGAGSAIAGAAGVGVIGAATVWAVNERLNNDEIRGSVGYINKMIDGNAELQDAFVRWVESEAALQAVYDSGDLNNPAFPEIQQQRDEATEAFKAISGWQNVYDAYSAWRQEYFMGNTDWTLPDLSAQMEPSGADVAAGLAAGISGNEGAATDAASEMGQATIDAANGALGVNSPSVIMIESGLNTVQGLAMGITSGAGLAVAAIAAVGNSVISTANGILNAGTASSIGYNVAAGLAAGIRSGSGLAAAAAAALASRVVSTLRANLQIASPSRVTYGIGNFTGMGFVNGILDNVGNATNAVGKVVEATEGAWNKAAWSGIGVFAGLEHDQLLKDAKDAVKVSDADIRKIRDLAEREVINQFTTAEVKVEMHNTNEIKSNMDLDGIVDYLGDTLTERLEAVAEGVYT